MGYIGAKNIKEIRTNSKFVKITKAGFYESMVHSVETVGDENLNYEKIIFNYFIIFFSI